MAFGPMLPHFFWIQEQDAVIRIIPTSGECCVSGGMQTHFGRDAEFRILCWDRTFPRAKVTPSCLFLREDQCRVFWESSGPCERPRP